MIIKVRKILLVLLLGDLNYEKKDKIVIECGFNKIFFNIVLGRLLKIVDEVKVIGKLLGVKFLLWGVVIEKVIR